MTLDKYEIRNLAFQLTAYERYGSVGIDDLVNMQSDELTFDDEREISDYNSWLIDNYPDDELFTFDNIDELLADESPLKLLRLGAFSHIDWTDDYLRFNGYGNLKSLSAYEILREMEENRDYCKWYVTEGPGADQYDDDDINAIIEAANSMIEQGA